MKRSSIFSSGLVLLSAVLILMAAKAGKKPETDAHCQTAPQGMVLVESDSLLPFYISVAEEPNINWQTYIQWQKQVFADYPEIHKNSMPKDSVTGLWLAYNDPLLQHYFEHPAFQWYPVTGVSWLQVLSYLNWKTDRLNEAILQQIGLVDFNPQWQVNETNFNTEAYLENQYDPYRQDNNKLPDDNSIRHGKRRFKAGDGVFFPHYRLPLEDEWLAGMRCVADAGNQNRVDRALKHTPFLKPWTSYFNLESKEDVKQVKVPYVPAWNFLGGVAEWLLDEPNYAGAYKRSEYDMLLQNGWLGFHDISPYDQYGELKEKDSIGKLGFNYVQISNINTPLYLIPPAETHYVYSTQVVKNPYYKNQDYADSVAKANFKKTFIRAAPYYGLDSAAWMLMYQKQAEQYIADSVHYTYAKHVFRSNAQQKRKYVASTHRQQRFLIQHQLQTASLPELGFRCVLPFTGVAVNRRYKVRW